MYNNIFILVLYIIKLKALYYYINENNYNRVGIGGLVAGYCLHKHLCLQQIKKQGYAEIIQLFEKQKLT